MVRAKSLLDQWMQLLQQKFILNCCLGGTRSSTDSHSHQNLSHISKMSGTHHKASLLLFSLGCCMPKNPRDKGMGESVILLFLTFTFYLAAPGWSDIVKPKLSCRFGLHCHNPLLDSGLSWKTLSSHYPHQNVGNACQHCQHQAVI